MSFELGGGDSTEAYLRISCSGKNENECVEFRMYPNNVKRKTCKCTLDWYEKTNIVRVGLFEKYVYDEDTLNNSVSMTTNYEKIKEVIPRFEHPEIENGGSEKRTISKICCQCQDEIFGVEWEVLRNTFNLSELCLKNFVDEHNANIRCVFPSTPKLVGSGSSHIVPIDLIPDVLNIFEECNDSFGSSKLSTVMFLQQIQRTLMSNTMGFGVGVNMARITSFIETMEWYTNASFYGLKRITSTVTKMDEHMRTMDAITTKYVKENENLRALVVFLNKTVLNVTNRLQAVQTAVVNNSSAISLMGGLSTQLPGVDIETCASFHPNTPRGESQFPKGDWYNTLQEIARMTKCADPRKEHLEKTFLDYINEKRSEMSHLETWVQILNTVSERTGKVNPSYNDICAEYNSFCEKRRLELETPSPRSSKKRKQ